MKKNLNQQLEDAFSALDEERVKSLLAAGADKRRLIRNKKLISCIGETCYKSNEKNTKCMKLLLANGANPNWIDPDPSWYDTCIVESLAYGNFDQAQLLVDNGANVNIRSYGDTPFTFFSGRIDCRGLDAMKFLHKNGANINAKNTWDGQTGLMKVTGFNDVIDSDLFTYTDWLVKPVEWLAPKAKINLRDKKGKTALLHSLGQNWNSYYAWDDEDALEFKDNFAAAFYYEIPTILLSNGAHVGIKDKSGKNAMNYAAADEEKMDLFARAIDDSNKFLRRKIVVMSR